VVIRGGRSSECGGRSVETGDDKRLSCDAPGARKPVSPEVMTATVGKGQLKKGNRRKRPGLDFRESPRTPGAEKVKLWDSLKIQRPTKRSRESLAVEKRLNSAKISEERLEESEATKVGVESLKGDEEKKPGRRYKKLRRSSKSAALRLSCRGAKQGELPRKKMAKGRG